MNIFWIVDKQKYFILNSFTDIFNSIDYLNINSILNCINHMSI